jgi:SCY1-like protein 1
LRHPYILPYIDGIELPDGINIVTESVVPLEEVLEDCRKHPQSLAWGVYQIAVISGGFSEVLITQIKKALAFLNNDCNLLYGNLSLSSIFVNRAGDWKLGGLELVSSHKDSTGIIRVFNINRTLYNKI